MFLDVMLVREFLFLTTFEKWAADNCRGGLQKILTVEKGGLK